MDVLKCLVFIYVLHLSLVQRFLALGIFLGPCGNPVGAFGDWCGKLSLCGDLWELEGFLCGLWLERYCVIPWDLWDLVSVLSSLLERLWTEFGRAGSVGRLCGTPCGFCLGALCGH